MKLSIPVFDRISANSAEKPAVTSSSPMISSAMLAFISSVCLFTSSSVAFSTSSCTPWSSFDRPASIRLVIAEIFACASATCAWLSLICVSKSAMPSSVEPRLHHIMM